MPCTARQLKNAAKWRDSNKDKLTEISRSSRLRHYDIYVSKERTRKLNYYYFKKECQRLMNILL